MHKFALLSAILTSVIGVARAGAPLWTQCGGIGWTGPTVCDVGVCTYANAYFSQCLPGTTSSIKTTTTAPSPTVSATKTTTSASVTCYTDLPTYSAVAVKATTSGTPVAGFSLHRRSDGSAVLNQSGAIYPVLHSNTICFVEPGPGCQYKDFLNVYNDATSPTASYKGLKFDIGVAVSNYWSTKDWAVTSASPWGAQSWFLACPTSVTYEYLLYLQTGSDVPPGQNCTLTQLT